MRDLVSLKALKIDGIGNLNLLWPDQLLFDMNYVVVIVLRRGLPEDL